MKRAFAHFCRSCGCNDSRSCRIVTQAGQRDCEWYLADLCDNPLCLISAASLIERRLPPDLTLASQLRERADVIRRTGG